MTDVLRLRPYAQSPARACVQVLADLSILAWSYAWVQIGRHAHDAIASASGAGTALGSGANALSRGLHDAAGMAGKVPFVGDSLASPLNGAAGAASGVAAAGAQFAAQVQVFAMWTGIYVAAVPLVIGLVLWIVPRYCFARRAAGVAELATTPAGEGVLALRALTGQPWSALHAVHPDPVAAWRAGDPEVVRTLAALQMRRSGVRAPRRAPAQLAPYPVVSAQVGAQPEWQPQLAYWLQPQVMAQPVPTTQQLP